MRSLRDSISAHRVRFRLPRGPRAAFRARRLLLVGALWMTMGADDLRPFLRTQEILLSANELAAMWDDLARADDEGTKKAFQAICRLVRSPKQVVPFLRAKLKPAAGPDQVRLEAWIADLDSSSFSTREKATLALEKLGPLKIPALKQKLTGDAPSLEVRRRLERLIEKAETNTLSGEELRGLRAIEVLEAIGSQEAKAVITVLAKGASGARVTEDAKRAQARLARDAAQKSAP